MCLTYSFFKTKDRRAIEYAGLISAHFEHKFVALFNFHPGKGWTFKSQQIVYCYGPTQKGQTAVHLSPHISRTCASGEIWTGDGPILATTETWHQCSRTQVPHNPPERFLTPVITLCRQTQKKKCRKRQERECNKSTNTSLINGYFNTSNYCQQGHFSPI